MVKQQILEDLKKIVKKLGFKITDPLLSIPKSPQFGDYSTNLALQLAKLESSHNKQPASTSAKRGESPTEIANQILKQFGREEFGKADYLEKVEIAGGGFINFFIKPQILAEDLQEILKKKENFGKSDIGKGKKARVEFVSANPTGPLHIGNARSGPLGDVLANILENCGYQVLREFIDNNVGEQVKELGATIKAKKEGNLASQNQYQGSYIEGLVTNLEGDIESKSDEEIGQLAVGQLHEEILADCHSMGIKFNLIVHESELRKEVPAVLNLLKKQGVLKKKEGALWFAPRQRRGSPQVANDKFLKDRETVVQKTDGNYTYFAADIVYHKIKFESGADLIIDIFGSNHHGHVPKLQAVVSSLGFDSNKLKVILYQYVRVKRGSDIVKMSKRAGDFITAREVLDEVGVDAFRFYLLKFTPQTHMDFDLELLKKQSNDNPVYYVQYAHARMSNIIQKSKIKNQNFSEVEFTQLKHTSEINLIKHLLILPDLVSELASNLQVHQLTEYAINLADLFHKFYESCPVLQADSADLKAARLSLVEASKITLANVLKLLGVSAPERM